MNILRPGQVIHDTVRILDFHGGGGQSFTYIGEYIDAGVPQWKKRVFIKQYNDLIEGTEDYSRVAGHYQMMRGRLAEKAHYLCLPDYIAPFEGAIVALYPYLEGKSLGDWMATGLSSELATRFAFGLTTAVRALHDAGIAHLDLKPDNVIIEQNLKSRKFFVHLIDVDAAVIDGKGLREFLYGSAGYMSPEHASKARRHLIGPPSDIYTLGIMLSELLIQRYPFPAFAEGEDVIKQRPAIPDNVLDKRLTETVRRCFCLDPLQRPRAADILRSLNESPVLKTYRAHKVASPKAQPPDKYERAGGAKLPDKRTVPKLGRQPDTSPQTRVRFRQQQFDHSYYSSGTLTRRNFVGSSVNSKDQGGELLCITLAIEGKNVYIQNRSEGITIAVGYPGALRNLQRSESSEIYSGYILEIGGSGEPLSMRKVHRIQIEID
ncbi:serine/threonine protein kinase [Aquibium oceanicum]|uniref:Protein kinase domain-containing protein n=1 Tax=Aquibium oceanicum TaxID=1670800 RepID=A0A1L3SKY8_9HYPH|nr:protein kinase [Aquibium oceanicum]APH70041.1 hypothetical protein BSQ44_00590 [Aquibium oceanicum]